MPLCRSWPPLPLESIIHSAACEGHATTSSLYLLRIGMEILHVQALIFLQEKLQPELLWFQLGLRKHKALLLSLYFSFFSVKHSFHLADDLTVLVAIRGICRFCFGCHVVSEFNGWMFLRHTSCLSAGVAGVWHSYHLIFAHLHLCFFLTRAGSLLHWREEGEVVLWLILWSYVLGWVWWNYSSFGWSAGVMAWMIAFTCSLAEYVLRNLAWTRLKPQQLVSLAQTLRWSQDLDQIGVWIEVDRLDLLQWTSLMVQLMLVKNTQKLTLGPVDCFFNLHLLVIWRLFEQTKCVEGAAPREWLGVLGPWSHLFPAQFFGHYASVLLLHNVFQAIDQSRFNDFSFSFALNLLLEAW